MPPVRAIAFHLPQFHPIPENDAWWGKGFTEWTNVVRAQPSYPGHHQPHLPTDLGFYDLRLPEARQAQAELAREHGIHGFCYYHYWFNGRRVLERPVDEILASGQPDFPFCLCWANENWTRRWDGMDSEVLLQQNYSSEDDRNHIQTLIRYFRDPRYITVGGRPLLLVYKLSHVPDPARTIALWRAEVSAAGLPGLYLCNVESAHAEHGLASQYPLDAAVEFAPDWTCLRRRLNGWPRTNPVFRRLPPRGAFRDNQIHSYEDLAETMMGKPPVPYRRFRGVTPMWDNSARRKRGATILHGATPAAYERWLRFAVAHAGSSDDANFVFINAWNEWAEGNHLEPCERWGRQYLTATANVLHT